MTTSARTIDLNADLGEGCPWDEPLLARVTSASVCCGAHAGTSETILATLRTAEKRGVTVGAHPGYADRAHFGRQDQTLSASEIEQLVRDQMVALGKLADLVDIAVRFVKPHGALYNQAQRDPVVATGVLAAVEPFNLPLLGQPGSQIEELARARGVRFVAEGFADRRYLPDGRLVPRSEPNAMLDDPQEIEAQVLRLADQGIETLCLHGDNPDSIKLCDLLLGVLDRHGIARRSFL